MRIDSLCCQTLLVGSVYSLHDVICPWTWLPSARSCICLIPSYLGKDWERHSWTLGDLEWKEGSPSTGGVGLWQHQWHQKPTLQIVSNKLALDALLILFISDTCPIKVSPQKEIERYSVELITVKKQAQVSDLFLSRSAPASHCSPVMSQPAERPYLGGCVSAGCNICTSRPYEGANEMNTGFVKLH